MISKVLLLLISYIVFCQAAFSFTSTIEVVNDPVMAAGSYIQGNFYYTWSSTNQYDTGNSYRIDYSLPTAGTVSEVVKTIAIAGTNPARYQNNRYLYCHTCDAQSYTSSFPNLNVASGVFGTTGVSSHSYDGRSGYKFSKASPAATEIGAIWTTGSSSSNPGTILAAQWGTSGKIWIFNSVQSTVPAASSFDISSWSCPTPTCTVVADICLVFDESGSIGSANFQKAKDFGVNISLSYTWAASGVDGIYMAFVAFATTARTIFTWTNSQTSAVNYIRNVVYGNGGSTCIGCGVQAATNLFVIPPRPSFRNGIAKVVYFMTDGQNNVNSVNFDTANNNAHSSGITTIAIGVGSDVNPTELAKVASTIPGQTTVFSVSDWATLYTVKDQLIGITCTQLATTPCGAGCTGFCSCQSTCVCPNCNVTDPCLPATCVDGTRGSGCTYTAKNCDDNNKCTTDSCVSGVGCKNTDNSARCNDNNACTKDSCDPANDCVNAPVTCTNPDPCIIPRCFPATGCDYNQTFSDCSFCKLPPARTVQRTCPDPNSALPEEKPDGNKCHVWSCSNNVTLAYQVTVGGSQYTLGKCIFTEYNCDDGNACTIDSCNPATGTCQYSARNCTDTDECTHDDCDAQTGCTHIPFTAAECNSSSLCISDSLNSTVPGCCVHTNISEYKCITQANITDKCVSYICKDDAGCIYFSRNCEDELGGADALGDCQVASCNSSIGCFKDLLTGLKVDKCGKCEGDANSVNKCFLNLTTTEAAGLGAGIIAAIIIAVVVFCIICGAVGGKVGLDYYRKYQGKMSNLQSNPLYADDKKGGANPFYQETS